MTYLKKLGIFVMLLLLFKASLAFSEDSPCESIFSAKWCNGLTEDHCMDLLIFLESSESREVLNQAAPWLSELAAISDPAQFPPETVQNIMALAGDPKGPTYLTFALALGASEDVLLHRTLVAMDKKKEASLTNNMPKMNDRFQDPAKLAVVRAEYVKRIFEIKVPERTSFRRTWKMIKTREPHFLLEIIERILLFKAELEPTIGTYAPDSGIWQTLLGKIEEAKQVIVDRYLAKRDTEKSTKSVEGLRQLLSTQSNWHLARVLIISDIYLGKRRSPSTPVRLSDLYPTEALFELMEDLRLREEETGENTYEELIKGLKEVIAEGHAGKDLISRLTGHIYSAYVGNNLHKLKRSASTCPLVVFAEPHLPISGAKARRADFFVQNLYKDEENILVEVKLNLGAKKSDGGGAGRIMDQLKYLRLALKKGIIIGGQHYPVHKIELRYEGGPIHADIKAEIVSIRRTYGRDSVRIFMTNLETLNYLVY